MSTALAIKPETSIIEDVIAKGDLKALSPEQRARYYSEVCTSMGLNPLSQPFQYIVLNGKLQLYATKGATDQLNRIHGISVTVDNAQVVNDVYVVTATGQDASGRRGSDIGAVNIKGLHGDALANAFMKATTKAKRRVTMSMCGLGMLDETEVESIPNAQRVPMETHVVEVPREVVHIASTTTETNDSQPVESWDLRLSDAQDATGKAQKDQFRALLTEATREQDTNKLRMLIKALPTYGEAENTMHYAWEKHGLHTPEMTDALKNREDAPGFVDMGSGEIVEESPDYAPVEPAFLADKDGLATGTITPKQLSTIWAITKKLVLDQLILESDVDERIMQDYGIESRNQLSKEQASEIITWLKELEG